MDERSSASDHKLTGVWDGVYSYPSGGPTVPFVATLIEAGRTLSGSTHEQCLVGGSPNETLFATLMGSRDASAVSFVKTYDGSNCNYRSVKYEGTVNGDATEIEGRWIVSGSWSGRFLMIRAGDAPRAAAEHRGATTTTEVGV